MRISTNVERNKLSRAEYRVQLIDGVVVEETGGFVRFLDAIRHAKEERGSFGVAIVNAAGRVIFKADAPAAHTNSRRKQSAPTVPRMRSWP